MDAKSRGTESLNAMLDMLKDNKEFDIVRSNKTLGKPIKTQEKQNYMSSIKWTQKFIIMDPATQCNSGQHMEKMCERYRKLNHFPAVCRSTEVKRG